jgi:LEA14-like dessication related protein
MAKKGNILGIIGIVGAAAAAIYLSTASALKKIEVGFTSVSSNIKFTFPNLYVPVTISIYNPNSKDLQFNSLAGEVYINGTKSTDINVEKTITLKAKATTSISGVIIKTEVFSTANNALDYILSNKLSINIKGTITANNMGYPFSNDIKLQ